MTTTQVANAVDADMYSRGLLITDRMICTVGEAQDAWQSVERPAMEAIAKRQNMWKKFWSRRGNNPITEVVEEYAN